MSKELTALRIIPCLDIDGDRVVKGTKFKNLIDAGDPTEQAVRYESEGADELTILDISATIENRKTVLKTLEKVRAALSIPITVGGGIKNADDAERLLNAGADRVSINSAALRDPHIIDHLASRFGVQCVVVAIDVRKKTGTEQVTHTHSDWELVINAGRLVVEKDPLDWAQEVRERGAGEILLTSIDRDGTGLGYDLDVLAAIIARSHLPVIASGGAVQLTHFLAGAKTGARALLAAGAFHRGELSIATVKDYLAQQNFKIRK